MGLRYWWHWIRGHRPIVKRVTVPVWDPRATGQLFDCGCGKGWAR